MIELALCYWEYGLASVRNLWRNRTVATIACWSVLRLGDRVLVASAIGWSRGWGESLLLSGISGRLAYSIIRLSRFQRLIMD